MPVTRVRIESDEPVAYQLDGDPGGMLPLDVEVVPHRLTLVVPKARDDRAGICTAGNLRGPPEVSDSLATVGPLCRAAAASRCW